MSQASLVKQISENVPSVPEFYITAVIAALLFACPLYAQKKPEPKQNKEQLKEPKLSKHQLALDYLKAARRALTAVQEECQKARAKEFEIEKRWPELKRSSAAVGPCLDYSASLNLAKEKADVCQAENEAGVARCKTSELESEHSYLLDIMYFRRDGSMTGTHYYFAVHEDDTYEVSEHEYTSSP
jgi:hypothetical protein